MLQINFPLHSAPWSFYFWYENVAGVASVLVLAPCQLAEDSLVSLISTPAWTLWRARYLAPGGEELAKGGKNRRAWMNAWPAKGFLWVISSLPMGRWKDNHHLYETDLTKLFFLLLIWCFCSCQGVNLSLMHAGQGLNHWASFPVSIYSLHTETERCWRWRSCLATISTPRSSTFLLPGCSFLRPPLLQEAHTETSESEREH